MSKTLSLLVIEDAQADFLLIERNLRQHGITGRLEQVSSPAALAQALEAGQWDAVLFDFKVPGIDFRAGLDDIHASLPYTPVILVSGSVGEEHAVELLKLGIDDFVLKDRLARLAPAIMRSIDELRERRELKAAQDELRESQARLRRALAGGAIVAWEHDLGTDTLSEDGPVDQLFDRPKGYRHHSLDDFLSSIHRADRQQMHDTVTTAIRNGAGFEREFRAATRDGSTRWIGAAGRVERNAEGIAIRLHGVATDITSRKLSELAWQASEAFNRGLLDSLADGVFIAQDAHFVFTNPALPAMLGYEPDEFIGLSFEQVIAPEYLDQWVQRFTLPADPADPAEQPRYYELQMLCQPTPLRRWVELRAGSIEFEQRPAVLGIIRDIGERKEAEVALADSEARANLMLDLVPEAMLLVDSTGHILRANVRAATLFDYPAEQLQGRIVEDLIPQRFRARHGSYHSEFRKQPTARLMGEGRNLTALRRDGSEIPVEVALGPAQIEGEPHVIVTLVDISDRNRTALELQRFVQIVNTSADMLAFVDGDLHFQVVNPSYAAQFGKSPAEVAGKAVRDMFTPETWGDIEPRLRTALAGEETQSISTRVFADGSRHVLDATYLPFRPHDETLGVVVSHRDVTERVDAEMALARESSRNQLLLRNASDGIHILDNDGRVIEVSESFCHMIGYTREDLIGASLALWDAKWDEEDLKGIVRHNIALNARNEFETQHRHRDGRLVDVEVSTQPIDLEGQRVLFCSSRDISQRRSAEEALRESEAVLERAQQLAHVGSWTYSVADKSFLISTECERMFVWPGKTLAFADLIGLVHPDDADRAQAAWQDSLSTGVPLEIEHPLVVRGAIKHLHMRGEVALDAQGRTHKVIGFTQDVTRLREAERALEAHKTHLEDLVVKRTAELGAAEAKFRGLVEQSFAAIDIVQDGYFRYVNPAFATIFGFDSPEDIVDRIPITDLVAPEWRQTVADNIRRRANGDVESLQYQFVGLRRDGSRVDVEVFGRRFELDGRPATIGLVMDITQRKRAEQAQAAALAEAERLAQVRSDFLANMSHEIRTPLSAMLGLAQIGLREDAGRRSSAAFSRILESGQLLLGVINDILDFSKIEAGKLGVEKASFDPCQAIDRAVDFTSAQAEAKGLEFEVEESVDLPSTCLGDELRLSQVLVNLLANAVKFTETGRVSLSASREGNWLRFEVVDTGIGMHPDQVGRLFRPFEQADSSTTRRFGGTGLGLAISSRLVNLMGGNLSVDSQLGRGSRFTLRLPLVGATDPRPRENLSMILVALGADRPARLAEALTQRGVTTTVANTAEALRNQADLIVIGCAAADEAVTAAAEQAIENGRRIAIACHHQERCTTAERLREHAAQIEYPLRARHLIAAVHTPRPISPGATPRATERLKGVRVLAAEDNALNRLVLDEIMRLEGAQLTLAEDGERALDLLQSAGAQAFDIVLTDIQMPGIDGYETARRVLAFAPSLPVIGLTAHAMREERERCLAAGMVEHLAKPIDIEALVAAVLRHVSSRAAAADAGHVVAAAAPAVIPPVDWKALEARFPGRAAFIDRLAETLLQTQSETPAKLREAAAHDERATIVFIAHTLKGMAGNLVAPRLLELSRNTETAGRAESADLGRLAVSLADAMAEVIDAMKARLAKRDAQ